MENCLVTKLKSVVDNDNLVKLGVIKFYVTQAASIPSGQEEYMQRIAMIVDAPVNLTVVGNGYIGLSKSDLQNHKTILNLTAGQYDIWFGNGTYIVEADNKYSITALYTYMTMSSTSIIKYNINDLKFNQGLVRLEHNGELDGNIENLPLSCVTLQFYNCGINGDISALNGRGISSLTNRIRFVNCDGLTGSVFELNPNGVTNYDTQYSDNISGNISELSGTSTTIVNASSTKLEGTMAAVGNITTLTELRAQNTRLTGSIEELVAARRQNGQSSGSMTVVFGNTAVTFNGSTDYNKLTDTELSWTATQITYNGTTIDA